MHTAVFRNNFFNTVPLRDVYGCEDALLTLEAINKKCVIAISNKIHLRYLVHENNVSSINTNISFKHLEKNVLSEIALYTQYIPRYISLNRKEKTALKNKLAEVHVWHLAYNTYKHHGQKTLAINAILQGHRLKPLKVAYWKTLFSTLLFVW